MSGYEELKKITVENLIIIHYEAAMHGYVARTGVKDRRGLWELIPHLKTMADERRPITHIAAVVMRMIAIGQPYYDANRRSAFLTGVYVLGLFGYGLNSPIEENEKLKQNMMAMGYEEIERWIQKWIIRT
jgi:prophage maintenance system killer protein